MTNEELRDKVPAAVMDQVVACDPRYQHHLPDGSFVLETEDGLVTLTLEQYLEFQEIGTDEIFYASLDTLRASLENPAFTNDELFVELFNLRKLFDIYCAEQAQARKALYEYARSLLEDK